MRPVEVSTVLTTIDSPLACTAIKVGKLHAVSAVQGDSETVQQSDEAVCIEISRDIAGHFVNPLRLRQNGCQFANDIFKCIFFNENAWISTKISLKFE